MLIVGSQAMRIGLEKVGLSLGRVPTDLDLLASLYEAQEFIEMAEMSVMNTTATKYLCKAPDGMMVEIQIADPGTSARLYIQYAERLALDKATFYGFEMGVATLPMLYSIKRAHRHSPRAFEKHVKDYNRLRRMMLCGDVYVEATTLGYQETVKREKLRTPSLMKSTTEFFDDNVSNRTFIHDQIHEVMAFEDRPMFERIKVDPDKVACSKEKFFQLTGEQRDHCVQEEAYVIALERCIIPMLFEGAPPVSALAAYKWAVMRICTTLCSGWFREYALENYDNLMLRYNWAYTDKFLEAVESGRIERIK